jgi:GNAT superfamily N-acetyltransferase
MGITYREIYQGEEENVCKLITECFNEFVAPGYSEDGIIEFFKYLTPERTHNRLARNHFILLALDGSLIVGVIEVRNNNHISLFFVRKEYQNQGIGKKLHEIAIEKCKTLKPDIDVIDVNSSPYAVPIYEKLGFVKVSDEQIENGMRFTPMTVKIS